MDLNDTEQMLLLSLLGWAAALAVAALGVLGLVSYLNPESRFMNALGRVCWTLQLRAVSKEYAYWLARVYCLGISVAMIIFGFGAFLAITLEILVQSWQGLMQITST